jgi:hypothetical protein
MSITYAGTTLAISAVLPATNDVAGFDALTWDDGICSLKEAPELAREWAKVSDENVCADTNTDKKGSSKWMPVTFPMNRIPSDTAQQIYNDMESSRTGIAAFRMVLPGPASEGGTFYFTAQVSKFSIVKGGGQDTIHTSDVELLIQTAPIEKYV